MVLKLLNKLLAVWLIIELHNNDGGTLNSRPTVHIGKGVYKATYMNWTELN